MVGPVFGRGGRAVARRIRTDGRRRPRTHRETVMYVTSNDVRDGRGCGHRHGRGHPSGGRGRGCDTSFAAVERRGLSEAAHAAVLEALDDERHAFAFYTAVLERFPDAMPFAHIVEAEGRHVAALEAVLRAYGREVPADRRLGSAEVRRAVPASVACACDIAVAAEIGNVGLYVDRLLPMVAGYGDVAAVFVRLMEASRDRHLPAFRRWTAGQRFRGGRA